MKHKRPKSSTNPLNSKKSFTHATPPKDFRVNEQDVYNYVRNSVHLTFQGSSSRNYELIKQYTNGSGIEDLNKSTQVDRLCKKYSILKNTRGRSFFEGVPVNVQQITSRYVKSKSKEKQKQEQRKRLKKDINTNYRYGPKPQYQQSQQFFSIQRKQLTQLQRKQKMIKSRKPSKQEGQYKHPYLKLYQNIQKQTIQNYAVNKTLEVPSIDYPNLPQLEEWQKNTQNLKKVFEGPPTRRRRPRRRQVKSARQRTPAKQVSFYLT